MQAALHLIDQALRAPQTPAKVPYCSDSCCEEGKKKAGRAQRGAVEHDLGVMEDGLPKDLSSGEGLRPNQAVRLKFPVRPQIGEHPGAVYPQVLQPPGREDPPSPLPQPVHRPCTPVLVLRQPLWGAGESREEEGLPEEALRLQEAEHDLGLQGGHHGGYGDESHSPLVPWQSIGLTARHERRRTARDEALYAVSQVPDKPRRSEEESGMIGDLRSQHPAWPREPSRSW